MTIPREQRRGLEPMLLGILSVGRVLSREGDVAKLARSVVDVLVESDAAEAAVLVLADGASAHAGERAAALLEDARASACVRLEIPGSAPFAHRHEGDADCALDGWTVVPITDDDERRASLLLRLDPDLVNDVFASSLLRRLGDDVAFALRRIANERALKETADALRATQRQLEAFIEHAPTAIAMLDRDLRYIAGSRRYFADFGLRAEATIGTTIHERVPPLAPHHLAAFRRALDGEASRCSEERFVTHAGTPEWIAWELLPWRDAAGEVCGVVTAVERITARKQAQIAASQSDERFATIFRSAPAAILITDLADQTIIDVNDAFCSLTGWSRDEALGRTSLELELYADPRRREEIVASVRGAPPPSAHEVQLRRRDGQLRDCVLSIARSTIDGRRCAIAFVDDVSDLRRAHSEASKNEARLRAAFELAPIGIVQTDVATRRFISVNERYCEITGYSADELLSMRVDDLAHPDDRDATRASDAALRAGEARAPLEKRYRRKDGATIWVRVLSTLVDEGGGAFAHTLGMVEDITERRRAETLRRLQTAALGAAADAIVITNTRGAVEWVNDAFCRLTGYDYAEVIGKNPRILRSGRQKASVYKALWETILDGRVWSGDLVNRRKDGSEYEEEMTITPVRDDRGELAYFVAMKRDITERRIAERALAEAEELQRLALDAGEQGMFVADLAGKTTRLDPRACEHFGVDEGSVASDALRALVPADDLRRVDEAIRSVRAANSDGRAVVELRVARANGAARWLSMHLRVDPAVRGSDRRAARIIGTTRDITLARRRDAELRASEERYRTLVDNLDHIIYSTDVDGRIVFVNRAITRLGYRPEDVIGLPVEDFVHPDEREDSIRKRALLLAGGQVVLGEYRSPDSEGRTHYLRVAVRPRVEHERIVGVTGIAIDVTSQRETEEQLRAAQKMEAVGRLAGGVAHDFNNLLSVILSYTELATLDLRPDDPLRADLDEIAQAAKRAAGLTRQLLAFSRRQLLQPEPLDLNELVSSIANMLRRLIGEDVELCVTPGIGLFLTKADRGQIEQVILNLVVNARDAMPDGGRVTLSSSNIWLDTARAAATDIPPGAYVELTVRDTGIGMDDATRERIFEPFFTTKSVGKGTGLGLSMVYGIVRQSGGGIFVESELGEGATFHIYLPRHEIEDPVPVAGTKLPRTMRGNEGILIVEDEAALRNVVRRTLTSVGYRVIVAANAAEALDVCTQRPDEVQLVLTDVVMPGMNGRELAEQLAHVCPGAKVLFMSGYTDEAIARHGVLGPGFLRKPFDRRTLTDTVRRVLDGDVV